MNRAYWEPRRHMIKIRLTYREREMIEQAASANGQTMTEYIIEACRDHQPRRRPPAETHQQRLAKRLPQNRGRR